MLKRIYYAAFKLNAVEWTGKKDILGIECGMWGEEQITGWVEHLNKVPLAFIICRSSIARSTIGRAGVVEGTLGLRSEGASAGPG